MSKKVIAGVLIGLTLGLTGCSVSKLINYEVKVINGIEYHSDDQFYKDTAEKFLSYLDARDKEGMKSLLCNALKNHEDIDILCLFPLPLRRSLFSLKSISPTFILTSSFRRIPQFKKRTSIQ